VHTCFLTIRNNKVYQNTCKKLVIDALSGKHSTILTLGPTKYDIICSIIYGFSGGKNYLLRGEETKDKGIILYFLEDILDLSEISRQSGNYTATLRCSVYGVYQNNVIDFLAPNLQETIVIVIKDILTN
jgi:Kinesin-like protein